MNYIIMIWNQIKGVKVEIGIIKKKEKEGLVLDRITFNLQYLFYCNYYIHSCDLQ